MAGLTLTVQLHTPKLPKPLTPVLVIRASQRLAKRLKLRLSKGCYVQGVPLLSWNADDLTFPKGGTCAFLSEDATLFSILLPLQSIRSEAVFISSLLERLRVLAAECGKADLFDSVNVIFTKRTDRRRIGSQNDLMWQCWGYVDDTREPFVPAMVKELEACANETPLSLLQMSSPEREMERLRKRGHA